MSGVHLLSTDRNGDCVNCKVMEHSVDISWGKIPFDPGIILENRKRAEHFG